MLGVACHAQCVGCHCASDKKSKAHFGVLGANRLGCNEDACRKSEGARSKRANKKHETQQAAKRRRERARSHSRPLVKELGTARGNVEGHDRPSMPAASSQAVPLAADVARASKGKRGERAIHAVKVPRAEFPEVGRLLVTRGRGRAASSAIVASLPHTGEDHLGERGAHN